MPRVKVALGRSIARWVTSDRRLRIVRWLRDSRRSASGGEATIRYFHQLDDPYSQLAATALEDFARRYRVRILSHAVPPPSAAAAPQLAALERWSQRDATRFAEHFGIPPPESASLPAGLDTRSAALVAGDALRRNLGHFSSAMFHFEGEWFWGLDRLHYLEDRLANCGLAHDAHGPAFMPPRLRFAALDERRHAPTLDFYCSLRSPYTWLATPRVRELARHYGANLRLKFVLPMVMRGLPVPLDKRLYILRDTKREARRLGLPFGDVADPVGEPTERGLAVLHHAIQKGRGMLFLEAFLRGVFAEGIDAGSKRGLVQIAAQAGLDNQDVDSALKDDSWRISAERHREELFASGLWGVPSFRVDDLPSLWGQDRLWMVEQDLILKSRASS